MSKNNTTGKAKGLGEICEDLKRKAKRDHSIPPIMKIIANMNKQDRVSFLETIQPKGKTFVIGTIFQHRNKDLVPVYMGNNFKNWLWNLSQYRIVSVNAFGKNILKEYLLPRNMNDTVIQSTNSSTPMKEDQMWAMLFLLITFPKLGKKIFKCELRDKVYVFHVRLALGTVVAMHLVWGGDEWNMDVHDFDGVSWRMGYVFLFPATA